MIKYFIKQGLLFKLVESVSKISGYAQIAAVIDNPKLSAKYIQVIIDEIDNTLVLLQQVAEIWHSESKDAIACLEGTQQLYH